MSRLLDRLLRRERPPEDMLARLEPHERVLTWATLDDGGILLATQRGLWRPEDGEPRRLEWHRINKATWREGTLEVIEAVEVEPGVIEDSRPMIYELTARRDLPNTVRQRVTNSVASTIHHPLPGGGGVRIVARRVSGVDGPQWSVRYDRGTDRHDPGVRARVAELLEAERSRVSEQA